jgi:hypothetical protein
MNEPLLTKDVPRHIQKFVLETKLKLWAETLSEVYLIDEFLEYCKSIEYVDNDNIEDILYEFALKYPDKLHAVPKEQRYNKWIVVNELD